MTAELSVLDANPTTNWIQAVLRTPGLTDFCFNGAREAWMDRGHGMEGVPQELLPQHWDDIELREWVLHELSRVGKTWDARHPYIDATSADGHRLHVLFPPLCAKGITVSIRKIGARSESPPDSAKRSSWQEDPGFSLLQEIVLRGETLVLSGSTGSGKTTLLTELIGLIPHHERLIALEDTPELFPNHPHFLSLQSRPQNADGYGEVTLRTLLKQTLRMRPDRILIGECRGDEVLELLQLLNTGHTGALTTLHANSPRDALRRLELLCLLASGGTLPPSLIRELLAHGIQWIAQVRRNPQGVRKITEIWRIEGREGDTILMRPMLQPETR
jgi:pilus assembly protein CpaF